MLVLTICAYMIALMLFVKLWISVTIDKRIKIIISLLFVTGFFLRIFWGLTNMIILIFLFLYLVWKGELKGKLW